MGSSQNNPDVGQASEADKSALGAVNRPLRLVACQQIIHAHFLWCGLVKGFRVVYHGASSSFEALSGCLYSDWRSCSCQDFVTALALGIPNQCTTCFGLLACSFRECRAGLFKL